MATQKEDQKLVFKTDYRLMQVKSIAECSLLEHSAILLTFIKLPFVFKTFILSILDRFYCISRPPDKSAHWKIIFFISDPKHMLWVLKRIVSM